MAKKTTATPTKPVESTDKPVRLAKAQQATAFNILGSIPGANPYSPGGYDTFDEIGFKDEKEWRNVVKDCRFFYRRDGMVSTVLNKFIELGINGIQIEKTNLSENQLKVYEFIRPDVEEFLEQCALEWLLSGLVLPEVDYQPITTPVLKRLGVKRLSSAVIPSKLWVRNPDSIVIKRSPIGGLERYYVEVDKELLAFLQNKGVYTDGTKDVKLYNEILKAYPEFVRMVLESNQTLIPIEPSMAFRRSVLSDSPYPTPFLASAIEPLRHKRNLRRMDYSIASRIISAILHFKVGTDEFPVTEGQEEVLDNLRQQLYIRDTNPDMVERVFSLVTNHTVEGEWIVPPWEALVDPDKYVEVNSDILYSLGFPRILITGEVQRTGTTDADLAILSPIKTMEYLRNKLIRIAQAIYDETASLNNYEPAAVSFNPINLMKFVDLMRGLQEAYMTGNLSRTDLVKPLGVNFNDTTQQLSEDNQRMTDLGLPEFGPRPFSNSPNSPNSDTEPTEDSE